MKPISWNQFPLCMPPPPRSSDLIPACTTQKTATHAACWWNTTTRTALVEYEAWTSLIWKPAIGHDVHNMSTHNTPRRFLPVVFSVFRGLSTRILCAQPLNSSLLHNNRLLCDTHKPRSFSHVISYIPQSGKYFFREYFFLLVTGYSNGVVSRKAPHALRQFSDLLCPHVRSNHSQFIHHTSLPNTRRHT
jgi:hypothetical protein